MNHYKNETKRRCRKKHNTKKRKRMKGKQWKGGMKTSWHGEASTGQVQCANGICVFEKHGNVQSMFNMDNVLNEKLGSLNEPLREIAVYLAIQRNKLDNTLFYPKMINYEMNANHAILRLENAHYGMINAFLESRFSIHDDTPVIFTPNQGLPNEIAASLGIRLCLSLFTLNGILNIAHNDMARENILVQTCPYDVIEYRIKMLLKTLVLRIPTFGVSPMICDFGRATTFSANLDQGMDDFTALLIAFNHVLPNVIPKQTNPLEILRYAKHMYKGAFKNNSHPDKIVELSFSRYTFEHVMF